MAKKGGFKFASFLIVLIMLAVIALINLKPTGAFFYNVSGTYKTAGLLILFAVFVIIYLNRNSLKGLAKDIIWFLGVLAGLYALLAFIPDINITIAVLTLSFGIMAIIWTLLARSVLSEGSSLKRHVTNFFFCLLFTLLASTWDSIIVLFNLKGAYIFPKYILTSIAYFFFVYTSYKILKLGREFGFSEDAKRIKKIIQRKP